MKYLWHKLAHMLNRNHGTVYSEIIDNEIWIGFKCTGCGRIFDLHKASEKELS